MIVLSILKSLASLLELLRVREQIRLKRLALDEMERIEDEISKTEERVDKLRKSGRHGDADNLVRRMSNREALTAGIFDLVKESDLYGDTGRNLGVDGDSEGEGPADTDAG